MHKLILSVLVLVYTAQVSAQQVTPTAAATKDNQSAKAVEGTMPGVDPVGQSEAVRFVDMLDADMQKYGAARVLAEIGNPKGGYINGDTLAFAVDRATNLISAHPIHAAAAVGKKTIHQLHDGDKRNFGQELFNQIQKSGWGYVRIRYASVRTNLLISKSIFCRIDRSGHHVLCASVEERAK